MPRSIAYSSLRYCQKKNSFFAISRYTVSLVIVDINLNYRSTGWLGMLLGQTERVLKKIRSSSATPHHVYYSERSAAPFLYYTRSSAMFLIVAPSGCIMFSRKRLIFARNKMSVSLCTRECCPRICLHYIVQNANILAHIGRAGIRAFAVPLLISRDARHSFAKGKF